MAFADEAADDSCFFIFFIDDGQHMEGVFWCRSAEAIAASGGLKDGLS